MEAALNTRRIARPAVRRTAPRIAAKPIEKKGVVLGRYRVAEWDEVMLTGSEHVIPAVCPACLAPAETEVVTWYHNWYGFDGGSAHQSFLYCAACAPMAGTDADIGAARWDCLLLILLLSPLIGAGSQPGWIGTAALVAAVALVLGGTVAFKEWRRQRAQLEHPRPAAAPQWGAAAFFIGHNLWGLARYRAVRREWLQLLVERNAKLADAETRARFGVAAHGRCS